MFKKWNELKRPKQLKTDNPNEIKFLMTFQKLIINDGYRTVEAKNKNNQTIYLKPLQVEEDEWFAPNLLKEFENLEPNNELKSQIIKLAEDRAELLMERGVSFKFKTVELESRSGKKSYQKNLALK
jgi:hypothetical protein